MNTNILTRKIGLWMDHAEAKFIVLDKESDYIRTVHSPVPGKERFQGEGSNGTRVGHYRSSNNEFHKHRKEENAAREYFEYLVGQLKDYDEIFILGPTTACNEFNNYLIKENLFPAKKVHIEKGDYLTDNQLIKLVKEYFSTTRAKN